MTHFKAIVALFTALLFVGVSRGAEDTPAARKPNIIVIVADDLGYGEIGAYGGKQIPTPHVDALAAGGVRFTAGYVTCPVCSPTRAGLLTGRYQQRFGHEFNPGPPAMAQENFGLPLSEKTLADRLKAAGYATGMVGKWHLGYKAEYYPTKRGFDEFYGFLGGAYTYFPAKNPQPANNPILRGTEPVSETRYLTDAFAHEAAGFIERNKSRPFFLYLTFNAVHMPMEADTKYLDRFGAIKDEKRRNFAAMLSAMDDGVGTVTAKLRELGLEKDTLIFFISDNGGPTPQTTSRNGPLNGTKGTVWEGGIRVPFIVNWPSRLPAGKVYDSPVISLDIVPTALAAARLGSPQAAGVKAGDDAKLDGVDLTPYLTGQNGGKPHESLYWRFGAQRAIRHGDMKLLWLDGQTPQLYDLAADVGEQQDLTSSKPEVVKQLTEEFAKWNGGLMEPLWSPPNRGQRRNTQPRTR